MKVGFKQIAAASVENNSGTQCDALLFGLTLNGEVYMRAIAGNAPLGPWTKVDDEGAR